MFELTPFVKHNAVYDPFKEFDEMEKRFFGGAASFRTDVKDTGDACDRSGVARLQKRGHQCFC